MNHQPTSLDLAADLRRCLYLSLSQEGFTDQNFLTFFHHALQVFSQIKNQIDPSLLSLLQKLLRRSQNSQLSLQKRREDLLTASLLLS